MSVLKLEKNLILIFDSRKNNVSLVELKLQKTPFMEIIIIVSEDKNVIISNVQYEENITNNNVCYISLNEINNVKWCDSLPELKGIT